MYYDAESPSGLRWLYDKFSWNETKAGKQLTHVGGVAGYLSKIGYWSTKINGQAYKNHRIIWELLVGPLESLVIDHIDGNPSNNRIGNLRAVTHATNCRNQKRNKRNISGISGVARRIHSSGRQYWVATWYNLNGRQSTKAYSVEKYGEDGALDLAVDRRQRAMNEIQALGGGYTERHINMCDEEAKAD